MRIHSAAKCLAASCGLATAVWAANAFHVEAKALVGDEHWALSIRVHDVRLPNVAHLDDGRCRVYCAAVEGRLADDGDAGPCRTNFDVAQLNGLKQSSMTPLLPKHNSMLALLTHKDRFSKSHPY